MSIKDVVITGILMGVSACLGMLCALPQSSPDILAQQVHNVLPLASFCMTAAFAALFIQDVSNRDALEFRSYWGGLGGGVGGFTVSPGVIYALFTLVFSGITVLQITPKGAEASKAVDTTQSFAPLPTDRSAAAPVLLPVPAAPLEPTSPTTLHIELPEEDITQ